MSDHLLPANRAGKITKFLTVSNKKHDTYSLIHIVASNKTGLIPSILKELLVWKLTVAEGGIFTHAAHIWFSLLCRGPTGAKVANAHVPDIVRSLKGLTSRGGPLSNLAVPESRTFRKSNSLTPSINIPPFIVEAAQTDAASSHSVIKVAVLGPSDLLSTEVVWSISDSARLVNVLLEEKDGVAAAVYFVQEHHKESQLGQRGLDAIVKGLKELLTTRLSRNSSNNLLGISGRGNGSGSPQFLSPKDSEVLLTSMLGDTLAKAEKQWGTRERLISGAVLSAVSIVQPPTASSRPLTAQMMDNLIKKRAISLPILPFFPSPSRPSNLIKSYQKDDQYEKSAPPKSVERVIISPELSTSSTSSTRLSCLVPRSLESMSLTQKAFQIPTSQDSPRPSNGKTPTFATRMASALGFGKDHTNSKAGGMARQTSAERYKDHAWSCLPLEKPLDMTCFELIEKIGTGLTSVVYLARVKTTSSKESLVVLKVMPKRKLVDCGQRVRNLTVLEHKITSAVCTGCPFILGLFGGFQDDWALYLVLETAIMDFFQLMSNHFASKVYWQSVQIYAAQVLLAIEHVHKCGYLYRDLKPENMLVKPNGSIRLADFGLSVNIATKKDGKATSICGTSEYMAPEMVTRKGYAFSAELWAFGIFCYEMIVGRTPFECPKGTSRDVLRKIRDHRGDVKFPTDVKVDSQFRQLITELVCTVPEERLGANDTPGNYTSIKAHPYFADLDWEAVESEVVSPKLLVAYESNPQKPESFLDEIGRYPWEKGDKICDTESLQCFEMF